MNLSAVRPSAGGSFGGGPSFQRTIIEPRVPLINAERAKRGQKPITGQRPQKLDQWLIVEDNLPIIKLVLKILKSAGINSPIVTANSETEIAGALTLASSGNLDIVLTDNRMPGLSGLDILRALRKRTDISPWIIAMSGEFTSSQERPNQLETVYYSEGADLCIPKPTGLVMTLKNIFSSRPLTLEELAALATEEPINSW